MIWSIAWKNIWRSRFRSLIVIAAFTVGIFSGVFTVALVVGVINDRVKEAIGKEVSHVQIHHPEYLNNSEIKYTIDNFQLIADSLLQSKEVKAVSARIKIVAMASNGGKTAGIMINGINPVNETKITDIYKCIPEKGGTYFGLNEPNQIVIGEKLAKDLKLAFYIVTSETLEQLREEKMPLKALSVLEQIKDISFRTEKEFDAKLKTIYSKEDYDKYEYLLKNKAIQFKIKRKLVLTFHAYDGSLYQGAFRVSGVYRTSNSMFDQINVYIPDSFLRAQTGVPENMVHEMAVLLNKKVDDTNFTERLKQNYPHLDIQSWKQLLPEVGLMAEWQDFYLLIIMGIVLLALGFGIINTMLMAILERTKELGMLMAVGMNKRRVFLMIMLETVMLSLVGTVAGMALSYPLLAYTNRVGINLSQFAAGFEKMGYSSHLFPAYDVSIFLQTTLLVIATGIIASIYPARRALKLNPADAVRSE